MPILGGCLCFDLPTGSKIIGALYVFAACLNTLSLAGINLMLWAFDFLPELVKMLENATAQAHQHNTGSPSFQGTPDDSLLSAVSDDYHDHEEHKVVDEQFKEIIKIIQEHVYAVKVAFLVLLCLAIFSIITASLLIHGVRKNRRGMLVPWVLQEILHLFIGLGAIVLIFILFGTMKVSWTLSIPIILCLLIQVFFIVVVVSQFQALGLIRMHDEMCMK